MDWNSKEIRQLRQRCGWSIAEMARQLGCRTETVQNFEVGKEEPDPEVCSAMENILFSAESNASRTIQRARAEGYMDGNGYDQVQMTFYDVQQIHRDDLES